MITATGCKKDLDVVDWNFTKQTTTDVQLGDWYQIRETVSGPDTWDGDRELVCGSVTMSNKYIRLCDDCARKEGLKW